MLKLGLTGSIATGKSTVLAAFAARGVPVFSSDEAVHQLYENEAVGPVGQLFPNVIHDGKVDRQALGAALVAAPERLAALEAVVHPLVRARIAAFLAAAEAAGSPLAVVDIPLLYEGGHDYGLDRVAVTVVDEPAQRRRALARPGMTVEKLQTILARQTAQADKRQRADYVFDTAKPPAVIDAEVAALIDSFGKSQ
jgi:dephospho-CoA kinase